MATGMTTTACPNAAWTVVYTAGAGITVSVSNPTPFPMKVRVGAGVAVGDSQATGFDVLLPYQSKSYAILTGEKIMGSPVGGADAALNTFA